jgi:hypothetical protein
VSALLEALFLLFLFVRYQDSVWVLGQIGLGVHIGDVHINDAICARGPEGAYPGLDCEERALQPMADSETRNPEVEAADPQGANCEELALQTLTDFETSNGG